MAGENSAGRIRKHHILDENRTIRKGFQAVGKVREGFDKGNKERTTGSEDTYR
jgi:hypothetical protein